MEGLSIGDAFGQRFFGRAALAIRRVERRELPVPPWFYTDDTEMALSIVEVLDRLGTVDQDELAAAFARRFDPSRGYGGMAQRILAAIRSGIDWRIVSRDAFDGQGSMGNGAAMRVAPLGAFFADDLDRAVVEAARSAEVTHAHPEGLAGAIAVAAAAALACRGCSGPDLLEGVAGRVPRGETRAGIDRALRLAPGTSPQEAAAILGSGARVLAQDTVPFAIWSASRHLGDFVEALWSTVRGLGDRDTTCAMAGGIVACSVGLEGIPEDWRRALESLPG